MQAAAAESVRHQFWANLAREGPLRRKGNHKTLNESGGNTGRCWQITQAAQSTLAYRNPPGNASGLASGPLTQRR